MNFETNRRRDAWPSINGFRYQLQVTILRWLALSDGSTLFCESGEDIDHVVDAMQGHRLVEQVRVRDTVSLRDSAVVSALGRFLELREHNPSITISYRFWTTAIAASEQGASFPRSMTGLDAWNAARTGVLSEEDLHHFLVATLGVLRSAKRPSSLRQDLFDRLTAYLAGCSQEDFLASYVLPIEWALGSPDALAFEDSLVRKVQSRGLAASEERAELVVDLLTAELLRMLSRPGVKQLTLHLLQDVTSRPALSPEDQRFLRRYQELAAQLEEVAATTSATLRAVQSIDERLHPIADMLTVLTSGSNATARVFTSMATALGPPPLPAWTVPRTPVTDEIGAVVRSRPGTWLHGQPGGGKTVTAQLVADLIGSTLWITLPDASGPQGLTLLGALAGAAGDDKSVWAFTPGLGRTALRASLQRWLLTISKTLIVIDNVEPMSHELEPILSDLIHATASSNSRLLITSQKKIPVSLLQKSPHDAWQEHGVPPLSEEDIADTLAVALGTTGVPKGAAGLLLSATKGHPVLVAAAVRHLVRTGWTLDDAVLPLLSGLPVRPVKLETRQSLKHLVPDEDSRRLLDRLSILIGPIERHEIEAIADIEPRVSSPGERILDLAGVWLQDVGDGLYNISPLLDGVGAEVLSASERRAVHLASGWSLLQAPRIDAAQSWKILVSLHAAEAWADLGLFCMEFVATFERQTLRSTSTCSCLWPPDPGLRT